MSILDLIKFRKADQELDYNIKAKLAVSDYGQFEPVHTEAGDFVAITPWNSEEGMRYLLTTPYNRAFFSLAHTYQPMRNPYFGSVASMVTVLNALRLDRGVVPDTKETSFKLYDSDAGEIRDVTFNIYTQTTLLDAETDIVKPRDKISPIIKGEVAFIDFDNFNPGLSLQQVRRILELYKCHVDAHYANDDMENGLNSLREAVKESCIKAQKFVIANFYGELIGLHHAGHYSTLAAYHEPSDSVLVLDTAAHKCSWYWVPLITLYQAMNTIGREGNKRGYLIVEDAFL